MERRTRNVNWINGLRSRDRRLVSRTPGLPSPESLVLSAAALALLVALAAAAPMPRAQTAAPQDDTAPDAALEDGQAADESDTVTDDERPLEDYEASEQISEDLSVSFPVDI